MTFTDEVTHVRHHNEYNFPLFADFSAWAVRTIFWSLNFECANRCTCSSKRGRGEREVKTKKILKILFAKKTKKMYKILDWNLLQNLEKKRDILEETQNLKNISDKWMIFALQLSITKALIQGKMSKEEKNSPISYRKVIFHSLSLLRSIVSLFSRLKSSYRSNLCLQVSRQGSISI